MTQPTRLLIDTAVWLAVWIAGWRFFYGPMSHRRIDYVNRFGVTGAYFLFLSLIAAMVFRAPFSRALPVVTGPAAAVLGAATVLQLLLYAVARTFLRRPDTLIEANPHEFFLRIDYRYFASKSTEVLFQQVMIAALVLTAARAIDDLFLVCAAYAFVFSLAHAPMMRLFGAQSGAFTRFYIAAALLSAAIFPPLILLVPGGPVYAYAIHSFFYTALGVAFWLKNTFARTHPA